LELQQEDYAEARKAFRTKLVRRESSPQKWRPLRPPDGVGEIEYASGDLRLRAWVSRPAEPGGHKAPAVLFLHGGLAFGESDWHMTRPYRDAGFVVLAPMLRGENGQPGNFSLFYDEVDDVLAAAEYLSREPSVDPGRVYIAGHSVGGTLVLLAAMASNRFRAAASFSASPDQQLFVKHALRQVPFDQADHREFLMRSPVAYARSLKCPARLYYGAKETHFQDSSERTARLAKERQLDVEAVRLDGDHQSYVSTAIAGSIEFFRRLERRGR
jgi:dipeptidyl aminopeptidase/acylaminoacyl peptidase